MQTERAIAEKYKKKKKKICQNVISLAETAEQEQSTISSNLRSFMRNYQESWRKWFLKRWSQNQGTKQQNIDLEKIYIGHEIISYKKETGTRCNPGHIAIRNHFVQRWQKRERKNPNTISLETLRYSSLSLFFSTNLNIGHIFGVPEPVKEVHRHRQKIKLCEETS